jgi:hypothetical protein
VLLSNLREIGVRNEFRLDRKGFDERGASVIMGQNLNLIWYIEKARLK